MRKQLARAGLASAVGEAALTEAGGTSGGAAILAKSHLHFSPVPASAGATEAFTSRVAMATLRVRRTQILLVSLYCWTGEHAEQRNTALHAELGPYIDANGGIYIIGGDWNQTGEQLEDTGFPAQAKGIIVTPQVDFTCTSGSRRLIDYFVIARSLTHVFVENGVDEGSPFSPHTAVRAKLCARPAAVSVPMLIRPRSGEVGQGMKAPMEWSTARALADQVLLIPHLRARAAQTMTAGDPLTEAYLAHGVAMDLWKGRAADKPIGDILRGLRVCTGGPPCVRVVPLRIKPAPSAETAAWNWWAGLQQRLRRMTSSLFLVNIDLAHGSAMQPSGFARPTSHAGKENKLRGQKGSSLQHRYAPPWRPGCKAPFFPQGSWTSSRLGPRRPHFFPRARQHGLGRTGRSAHLLAADEKLLRS